MGLVKQVMDYLWERRQNLIDGKVNCIPSPFKDFSDNFIGIEQETYYTITAGQKTGKSQFLSFMFLYNPILYAYYNPSQIRVKIFYAPLEESKEKVVMRFMRYLLFLLSDHKIRVTHHELTSARAGHPVNDEILAILESEEYQKILSFFEEHIVFMQAKNPTGLYKELVKYAVNNGERVTEKVKIKNEFGDEQEVNKFVRYIPKDPDEYVIIAIDHVSLLQEESGKDKRQTIRKWSEYCMELRDYYRYIPVNVQQQSIEIMGNEAFKLNRIRPTPAGLSDCKDTRYDVNVMLGLSNPYAMEVPSYMGYDITKLKDNQRFLEVMLSRDGTANAVKALYFDGAVSFFSELPNPRDENFTPFMERVYALIESLRRPAVSMMIVRKILSIFRKK